MEPSQISMGVLAATTSVAGALTPSSQHGLLNPLPMKRRKKCDYEIGRAHV